MVVNAGALRKSVAFVVNLDKRGIGVLAVLVKLLDRLELRYGNVATVVADYYIIALELCFRIYVLRPSSVDLADVGRSFLFSGVFGNFTTDHSALLRFG